MLKWFALVLVVILAALYFLGVDVWVLRMLGYIFTAFGILVFIMGGWIEEGDAMWGGSPWVIKVAAVIFILGLVLIFAPLG